MRKTLTATAFAALLAGGALAYSATGALADVVCNDHGECWHTHDHYSYPPTAGVVIHPDDWRWRDSDHYQWHEHDGRGYWRGGVWIGF
jgi:hypothetical protein